MNSVSCLARTSSSMEPDRCCHAVPCRMPTAALPTQYTPFSLEWAGVYRALYKASPVHSLAYSLPNLWAWKDWMGLEVRFAHGLAWMRSMKNGPRYLAPVGNWSTTDWKSLQDEMTSMGEIIQVPPALGELWQAQLSTPPASRDVRDAWEYLYSAEDLATLAGKRYHMQRNHVNAYAREHGEPDMRSLDAEHISAMLTLTERWYEGHDTSETATAEIESLRRLFGAWNELDLFAEGLFLNDNLAAFAIGHELNDSTMAVLYEKAEPGLRGAFPVMASSFARFALDRGNSVLNRAEDMGEEGLRKSKMLYRPVDFQRFTAVRFEV